MATYQVAPGNAVQGAQSSATLAPTVVPLNGITSGSVSTYYYAGDQATDVQLGGATPVARFVSLGAIVQVS